MLEHIGGVVAVCVLSSPQPVCCCWLTGTRANTTHSFLLNKPAHTVEANDSMYGYMEHFHSYTHQAQCGAGAHGSILNNEMSEHLNAKHTLPTHISLLLFLAAALSARKSAAVCGKPDAPAVYTGKPLASQPTSIASLSSVDAADTVVKADATFAA